MRRHLAWVSPYDAKSQHAKARKSTVHTCSDESTARFVRFLHLLIVFKGRQLGGPEPSKIFALMGHGKFSMDGEGLYIKQWP